MRTGSAPGRCVTTRIGDGGGSNFTFLLERGDERFVLRTPAAAAAAARRRTTWCARRGCRTRSAPPGSAGSPRSSPSARTRRVLGVPFYVMRFLDGHVITDELPAGLESEDARHRARARPRRRRSSRSTPPTSARPELAAFARPGSYLERQVRRFTQLWEINKTRELPEVEQVGAWLDRAPARAAAGRRSCTATTGSGT